MMAVIAAMFAFASCADTPDMGVSPEVTKLATPVVEIVDVTETGFTAKWAAVEGATSYSLSTNIANQKMVTTNEVSYKFENLNRGEYTVRVKATGEGKEDSDFSEMVKVTLTGTTSADWFTQTVALVEDTAENRKYGYYQFNAVDFVWKGTGVASVMYSLFEAESIKGWSDDEIINQLEGNLDGESLVEVNSAEGFARTFTGLQGSTKYTLCALATNEAGIQYLAKNDIVTAETQLTDQAKAWLGTWTAKTNEKLVWSEEGIVVADGELAHSLSITSVPGYADYVYIDGLSVWGEGLGLEALGQMAIGKNGENYLYIWNNVAIQQDNSGATLGWTTFSLISNYHPDYDGQIVPVGGDYPSHILELTEEGVVCTMYVGTLDEQGVSRFEAISNDLYWSDSQQIYILEMDLNEDGETEFFTEYHAGEIVDFVKTADEVVAPQSVRKANYTFNKSQFSSVVIK